MIIVTVEQLTGHIKVLLASDPLLSSVWVTGEVSNLSRPASGHCYFTLKDGAAQIRCALFRRQANPAALAALAPGAQVLAHGAVSLYETRGDLQLYVDAVQPEGVGVLQAEFERLFARLEAEGLFALERKRPLPPFPRRIGVVTSPSGAVWHDIRQVLSRRWPLAELVLAPSPVQGDGAAESVATAIERLNQRHDIDLLMLARGGGSLEDLWTFNEERVVRAIFASRIPIVSAIGHETDYTLCDYVADLRAPTPSAAAELVVPDRAAIALRVGGLAASLRSLARRDLAERRDGVRILTSDMRHCRPRPLLLALRSDGLARSLRERTAHALTLRAERFEGLQRRLEALSPDRTLARGYALVHDQRGALVSSRHAIDVGERVTIRLRDGSLGARVEGGVEPAAREPEHARQTQPQLL